MNVLVTGAAGYIGSHASLRLLMDGHCVVAVDDLSRGHRAAIDRLTQVGAVVFHEGDLGDHVAMTDVLRAHAVDIVMHFGAKAYVGESVEQPLMYYRVNTGGTLGLLRAMDDAGVRRLVFSSTAATYGEPGPESIPIRETTPQHPINPYGRSKLFVEQILADYARARPDFAYASLRYFNVAGSDAAGRIGEDHDPETHLIPICLQAALGQRSSVTIFGSDYDTPDGTCVRDYVHVEDLIDAHVLAMDALRSRDNRCYNVGIGHGYSVREVVASCRRVSGVDFEVVDGARRPGDPPTLYADATAIRNDLEWTPRYVELDDIIATAWRWFEANPRGYARS